MATFEERLLRLRKEMDQIREEKTRLNVALDFSKDERNLVNKQLKEAQDKTSALLIITINHLLDIISNKIFFVFFRIHISSIIFK